MKAGIETSAASNVMENAKKSETEKAEMVLIETALILLKAPEWLFKNIEGILSDRRQTIFSNQIINALRIGIRLLNGDINLGMLAPMQSGKSGTIYFLCNYVLRAIGFLEDYQHAAFITSMRDKSLYDQNKSNLNQDAYDYANRLYMPSNILIYKIDEFFKRPNPYKAVTDSNIRIVVRDEDQYGAGSSSTFDEGFFNKLRVRLPYIPLLSVSATPFDILDARRKGYSVSIIEGERPATYFGITEMLDLGLLENLPGNFNVFEKCGPGRSDIKLHSKVEEYAEYLLTFNSGIGIVRVKSSQQAIMLRNMIKSIYQGKMDCLFIGSTEDCDYTINHGIEEAQLMVVKQQRRVFLIIVQALGAGKDFKMLKEYFRFGIETRESQLANAAQGLPGRFCGYHSNRTFKLLACTHLLEKYSEFENDTNVFYDKAWRRSIYNEQVSDLTSQSNISQEQKAGAFIPVEEIEIISIDELCKFPQIKKLISKIGPTNLKKLMDIFDWKKYDLHGNGSGFRLNDPARKITVRAASSYLNDGRGNNRLYTIWKNLTTNSDFGSAFFKKRDYQYGILCSNYPVDHPKNTLGFCGIMLVKAGTKITRTDSFAIDNASMYNKDAA